MSESSKGKKHSFEVQQKINANLKRGEDHPNKKPENREKLRMSYLKRKEKSKGKLAPFYNISACKIFNEINEYFGWNGIHAENEGEYHIRGWWLDFYEKTENIVIEYDESHHKKRLLKDAIKEVEVVESLGCKFFRIKETDNWRDILINIKAHSSIK